MGPVVLLTHSSPEASNHSIAAWHRGLVWQSPQGAGARQKGSASSGIGLNVFPIPDLDLSILRLENESRGFCSVLGV